MTALDKITAQLAKALETAQPDLCDELACMMCEYEEDNERTLINLQKVPGFKKLWLAMEKGAHASLDACDSYEGA